MAIPTLLFVVACAGPRLPARTAAPRSEPPARTVARQPEAPPRTIAAAAPPSPGPLPDLDRSWGTAGPIALVAASPERRWLAFCQARVDTDGDGRLSTTVGLQGEVKGDALEGFFADEPGDGEAIQAFAGSDPSGRFVAFVREGRLVLRDTARRADTVLEADLRDDLSPFVHPRFLAFDGTGARLAYAVKDGASAGIRIRELDTGAEVRVDAGAPELYRFDFDPSGRFVVFTVSPSDSNGNGRVDWPAPEAPGPWMRCHGPLPRYPAWIRRTDDFETRVARVDGTSVASVPGLVVPLSSGFVVREPDLALELLSEDGTRRLLLTKECSGHVLHADATRDLLVVTCEKKRKRPHADVLLLGPTGATPLGLEVSGAFGDRWADGAPRLVPLYPGADTVLLDADDAHTDKLQSGDRVLASTSHGVLVARGPRLVVHGLDGKESRLPGKVSPLSRIVRSTTVLAAPPLVVDLEREALLGTTDARALAVANDGSVLVPARDANASSFAEGPLLWKALAPALPEMSDGS